MTQPPDGRESRSPMAIAAAWGSRITTIALEMVVPGLVGFWIDSRLGTKVLFGMIGFAFGLTLGVWHLVQMAKADDRPPKGQRPADGGGTGQSGLASGEAGSSEAGPDGPGSGGPR